MLLLLYTGVLGSQKIGSILRTVIMLFSSFISRTYPPTPRAPEVLKRIPDVELKYQ